ncbi:IclR family transcriptional regulator [Mycobacteroides abscessus subsp. abscessus]|nr:IclR family transcriptional regulator [Mycobacteroides abscessus subsp. abscessus]
MRDPHLHTYGLGPALIAAGRVAQDSFAISAIARAELAKLSETYRTTCTASAVVGDRISVLESTGPGMVKVGASNRTRHDCARWWPSAGSAATWWRASPRPGGGSTRYWPVSPTETCPPSCARSSVNWSPAWANGSTSARIFARARNIR